MPVERVGVAFEPELLKDFDALIAKQGYANRSEAVRDLVRDALSRSRLAHKDCKGIGTISILYNHHDGDVMHRLVHLQHDRRAEILTTTHIHVNDALCLEVLIAKGKASEIRRLADGIRALKGVQHGEVVITDTIE